MPGLLALNNAHAESLSWLEPDRLKALVQRSTFARCLPDAEALIVAFDQDAGYDGSHYAWFQGRYPRFLYIDRVVVAPTSLGRGIGRRLYQEAFSFAREGGLRLVACEINSRPANPASDNFHAALGFVAVGCRASEPPGKSVRYYVRALDEKSPAT